MFIILHQIILTKTTSTMKIFNFAFLLFAFTLSAFSLQAQDEKSAADVYNEGVQFLKSKDYVSAFSAFENAIAMAEAAEEGDSTMIETLGLAKKNGPIAAYYLGNQQRKAKKYDEALATFDKGIMMSEFYPLFLGRAQALDKADRDMEAAEAYLIAAKKYEEAEQDEETILKLYRSAFLKIARAKDHNLMIEKITAYPMAAKDGDVSYYAAKAYKKKPDYAEALKYAQAATSAATAASEKDLGKYYMLEGEILTAMGNQTGALEAYKKVPSNSKYAERATYFVNKLGGK